MKVTKFIITLILCTFILGGCSSPTTNPQKDPQNPTVQAWAEINKGALLIDVRSAEEYALAHIEGALNIPHDQMANRLAEVEQTKDKSIVLYCRSGRRAKAAKGILQQNGYLNVLNAGGYLDLHGAR